MHLIQQKTHVKSHDRKTPSGKTTHVWGYNQEVWVSRLNQKEVDAVMAGRPPGAVTLDRQKDADIPKDETAWENHPGRYDLPGIDTKSKKRKRRRD